MDIGLEEVAQAADLVRQAVHPDALSIFGATFDESLDDEIRVTVIATGFEDDNKPAEPEKPALEPLDPLTENEEPKKSETDPDFESILGIFKNKNF